MIMKKLKLLFATLALMATSAVWAQTDVTSTYLTNADFSLSTPIDNHLCGYGKDMEARGTTYYGIQDVNGWTSVITDGDNSNPDYPNSGVGGAVFAYGSEFQLKGNNVTAPAAAPDGGTGNALGFFAVWTCGAYYYQDVTLPAGNYTITFPIYCQSGTQASTSNTGFFPTEGDAITVAVNTTVGKWVNQSISFTLTEATPGQIRLGYRSTGNGSSANPNIFFDCVKIESISALEVAKNEALAALPATGGDNFFTMPQADIDEFTQRINAATTEAEINNIKDEITSWVAPATIGTWNVKNVTAACYLGTDGESVVLSELPVAITFEKATNGFYIKAGENYINMKGSNNWDMSATATATTEWTFTLSDGVYTISGPNGMIGTDNTTAGSPCYGDKNASKNGTWTISEAIDEEQVDIIVAKNALEAAINEHSIPTTNIGTDAFQYNSDDVAALSAKIETAKGVLDSGTATKAQIEAQTAILSAIEPLLLNTPANGQLFNLVLTYGGWDYDQHAVTYIANGRADAGLYNIQYTAEANKNLAQAFTFTNVEGNNYILSQIDADGVARYLCTGTVYGGNANQIRTTTEVSEALEVTIIPTATEGVYNIWNTEANQYIGSQDAGFFTVNSHIDFNIVETTKPSIEINTTAAGWGTVMLPFSGLEVPAGIKAYTCAAVDGTTLTLEEVSVLTANTPYIIEGAWNETVTGDAQGTALGYTEGLLTGVYADADVPVGSYVLQKLVGIVGFYKVAEGKQPTVGENHAYLTVTDGARAYFLGGEATGIEAVNALLNGSAEIYGMGGARQNGLQKGVNIIKQNGKTIKVMVK